MEIAAYLPPVRAMGALMIESEGRQLPRFAGDSGLRPAEATTLGEHDDSGEYDGDRRSGDLSHKLDRLGRELNAKLDKMLEAQGKHGTDIELLKDKAAQIPGLKETVDGLKLWRENMNGRMWGIGALWGLLTVFAGVALAAYLQTRADTAQRLQAAELEARLAKAGVSLPAAPPRPAP